MDKEFIRRHWYADIYEQQENQTNDVVFLLSLLGQKPLNILEIACGGGRISIPLALAGHNVTGFDSDEFMLEKMQRKAKGMTNISFYSADAITEGWGKNYDIVILAGNIMLNIVTDGDYIQAQELFIQKAAACVKKGGYMYLDFDCYERPDQTSDKRNEWVCFEGTDDLGTYGKYIVISGDYSSQTHIDRSYRRYEITPKEGDPFVYETISIKHFPTFEQVKGWLDQASWEIVNLYGDYNKNSISENTNRAIIYARKTDT